MSPHEEIIASIEPAMERKQFWSGVVKARRVVRLCLRYWPTDAMPGERTVANSAHVQALCDGLRETVKRKYGNPFLLLILSPLITFAINALLDWWFDDTRRGRMRTAIGEERARPEP